jgi:hypothetical protein
MWNRTLKDIEHYMAVQDFSEVIISIFNGLYGEIDKYDNHKLWVVYTGYLTHEKIKYLLDKVNGEDLFLFDQYMGRPSMVANGVDVSQFVSLLLMEHIYFSFLYTHVYNTVSKIEADGPWEEIQSYLKEVLSYHCSLATTPKVTVPKDWAGYDLPYYDEVVNLLNRRNYIVEPLSKIFAHSSWERTCDELWKYNHGQFAEHLNASKMTYAMLPPWLKRLFGMRLSYAEANSSSEKAACVILNLVQEWVLYNIDFTIDLGDIIGEVFNMGTTRFNKNDIATLNGVIDLMKTVAFRKRMASDRDRVDGIRSSISSAYESYCKRCW